MRVTRTHINLPKAGMGIEEGVVFRWLKSIGDQVQKGELLVEVETAKALQEIEVPVSGKLVEILVAPGEATPVNTPLGVIESSDG